MIFTPKDKPFSCSWCASGEWLHSLDLPPARGVKAKARAAILLDATIEAAGNGRWISYSRNRNHYAMRRRYAGPEYSFSTIPSAVDALAAMDLIEHRKSRQHFDRGKQSTFRASPVLLDAVTIPPADHRHREPIAFKDGLGQLVDYQDTERTRRMRRDLAAINDAIGSTTATLPAGEHHGRIIHFPNGAIVNVGRTSLHRVFNAGWTRGGRLYGHWVQNVPRAYRDLIEIDGEQTAEPDFPQLHPVLLYAMIGLSPEGDAYTLDRWPRPIAKRAFNVIVNAPTYASALGAVSRDLQDRQQAAQIIMDLKERHAPIARFFHSGAGLFVQNIDAKMATDVLRDLLGQNVVALPIHDSFRVQKRHEQVTREAMEKALWTVKNQAQNGGLRLSGIHL